MKKYVQSMLASGLLLMGSAAWADEFDITMDVVDANESFDGAIVNRIALPFDSRQTDGGPDVQLSDDKKGLLQLRDELESLVGTSPAESGADTPGDAEGLGPELEELVVQDLPDVVETGGLRELGN